MSRWKKEQNVESTATQKTGSTESFFSRHVKLITFLATVGVFLAIFGPIFVLEAKDYFGQDEDTRPEMKLYDLVLLSEQEGGIALKQLTQYACMETTSDDGSVVVVKISFADDRYMVIATADKNTGMVVECQVLDNDTNQQLDVLNDDLRAHFGQ